MKVTKVTRKYYVVNGEKVYFFEPVKVSKRTIQKLLNQSEQIVKSINCGMCRKYIKCKKDIRFLTSERGINKMKVNPYFKNISNRINGKNVANDIFLIICTMARDADKKAEDACAYSRYSIQDYWMCIEFQLQQLADVIAIKYNLDKRCPKYDFRKRLTEFKNDIQNNRRK